MFFNISYSLDSLYYKQFAQLQLETIMFLYRTVNRADLKLRYVLMTQM